MKKVLKKFIRKLIYGDKASSQTFIRSLRGKGMRIGEETFFYSPRTVLIDATRPWLIEIGKNVHITHGVVMLTHGYDWTVIKGCTGEILGSAGKIKIGDNVFIGANTTILKNVTIGNNVIIGAGSLVNKNVPDNSVVAGNPAKVITTIEEYRKKRLEVQLQEARELVREYYECYHKVPPMEALHEFFWLFEKRTKQKPGYSNEMYHHMMTYGKNTKSEEAYYKSEALFDSYEAFIESCGLEKK